MGLQLLDYFIGPANSNLNTHAPDVGGPWALQAGWTGKLDGAGQQIPNPWLYSTGLFASAVGAVDRPWASTPADLASADYTIQAIMHRHDTAGAGAGFGLAARWDGATTFYSLTYSVSSGGWDLAKTVAGVVTGLVHYVRVLDPGASCLISLTVAGDQISAMAGDHQLGPVTDATIAGPGKPALYTTQAAGFTQDTGLHWEAVTVTD